MTPGRAPEHPEAGATRPPPEIRDGSLDERLAWAGRMADEARAQGRLHERSVEETVAGIARLHRALAHIRG